MKKKYIYKLIKIRDNSRVKFNVIYLKGDV